MMRKAKEKLTPIPSKRLIKPEKAKSAARTGRGQGADKARTRRGQPPSLDYISPGLRDLARPCDTLAFHPHNPRKHSDEQIARIAASLRTKGQCKNIVASTRTEPPTVICGNGTLRAALFLNWSHIAVELKKMTEAEENALAVLDNQIALESEWDADELALAFKDFDIAEDPRLEELMNELREEQGLTTAEPPPEDPGPQIDRAAELQKKWKTALGQIWEIPSKATPGKSHRLLCGDSTKPEDVAQVMGGEKAGAVITDPPYGIRRKGIANDEVEGLRKLFDGCLALLPVENAAVIAFQSPRLFWIWLDAARLTGHAFERMLWMYKPNDETFPWRGWLLKSEAILATSVGKAKWQDVHPYSHDVYSPTAIGKELAEGEGSHPSVKPLSVVADLMKRCSVASGSVYDPFLGSGTTIIAAEQTGRLCYGLEIEPKYVAVCLERLAGLGLEPRRA